MIDSSEMLAYFKDKWQGMTKARRLYVYGDDVNSTIIQRAVYIVESFVRTFQILHKGYSHYRAVAANTPYDVPIGQGVKIAGTVDAVLLRNYMQDDQTLQVIHVCDKKVCDIIVDAGYTPFYKNVVAWMFDEQLNTVALYDITAPVSVGTRQEIISSNDAVTALRNVAQSMYIESIYPRKSKGRCPKCAYYETCSTHSLRQLITSR